MIKRKHKLDITCDERNSMLFTSFVYKPKKVTNIVILLGFIKCLNLLHLNCSSILQEKIKLLSKDSYMHWLGQWMILTNGHVKNEFVIDESIQEIIS